MAAVLADTQARAPEVLDLPIGSSATGQRDEFDSLGTVIDNLLRGLAAPLG